MHNSSKYAYANTLKDLSGVILDVSYNNESGRENFRPVVMSGSDLLEKINESYNKICNYRNELSSKMTMDQVYMSFLRSIIHESEEKAKNIADFSIKQEMSKMTNSQLNSIISMKKEIGSHSFTKSTIELAEKEFLGFIDKNVSLSQVSVPLKECIEASKANIKKYICRSILSYCGSERDKKNLEGITYRLYKANKGLFTVRPTTVVEINLIDQNFNPTGKKMKVVVLPETFEYQSSMDSCAGKYHYLFPYGLRILKTKVETTTYYFLGVKTSSETKSYPAEDVTSDYRFNFLKNYIFPITDSSSICTSSFSISRSFFFSIRSHETEIKNKLAISSSDDTTYTFPSCKVNYSVYINSNVQDIKKDEPREFEAEKKSFEIQAVPTKLYERTNTAKLLKVAIKY